MVDLTELDYTIKNHKELQQDLMSLIIKDDEIRWWIAKLGRDLVSLNNVRAALTHNIAIGVPYGGCCGYR